MDRQPNFILIITDQHRADHIGCYGNQVVRTPNIDGLAAAGTRFDRFYVATPICMPNRATLMTGRMPSLHGARQNGIPLSLTATTFVDIMRAAGYDTALIGKCHLQSISANPPTIGMPEVDPNLTPPPEHLREADKTLTKHGRYDQELPSTWEREPEFELIRAKVKGDAREIEVLNTHITGDQIADRKSISVERWKVSRRVWRFTMSQSLEPGEYVLAEVLPGEGLNHYVWDFGVDGPATKK